MTLHTRIRYNIKGLNVDKNLTTVLDPPHQNTLKWRLADFREISPSFKPLMIYLNLVCNVIGLAVYSDFYPFWRPWFHTCALWFDNCALPASTNTLTWRLADFREISPSFKPFMIYLNLVCNVNALAEYSDFYPFWRPWFHTCALWRHNCAWQASPEHPNMTAGRF